MTYLMVDISGRSPVYDIPLCEALHKALSPEHHLKLLAPSIDPKDVDFDCGKLFNILPHRLRKSKRKPFRAIKALMVILHYIEGYEIRHVSEILKLPASTVKTRLMRGRARLRDILNEEALEEHET